MEVFIPITMFLCIAAVAILRPLTKRMGGLLEAMTRERTQVRDEASNARVLLMLEQVGKRLDLIEERLDFTERLVDTRKADVHRFPRRASEPDELEYASR